ncbi:MAG TPA: hypothetical protein VN239_08620 [Nitrososphaera sp.]|nr:hypothetical protein [Nitrososphaera sp.]
MTKVGAPAAVAEAPQHEEGQSSSPSSSSSFYSARRLKLYSLAEV